ncbi:MAG TPA: GIY-YIG nuclease family protein [Roseiflexaceae bacterium]|nr:GIY-YIG nuclease family protein [Roseiflexaceae bacterium]
MKGTYLLILRLDHEAALRVGRLGQFTFAAGFYLYVGSAFGPGGLPARLSYHQQRARPHPHWHIDYLRPHARLIEAWAIGCGASIERGLVDTLAALPELSVPARRFGASDSDRRSHLLYTPRRPSSRALTSAIIAAAEGAGEYARALTIEIHTYDERDEG